MEKQDRKRIDKRLQRIERWLKRCMVACQCGSWSSALMEIECMEAETSAFRDDLWRIAEGEALGKPRIPSRGLLFGSAKILVLAMVFVLSIGIPLSRDQDRPFQPFAGESIAFLTSTESDILDALRTTLSNHNTGRVVVTLDMPELPAPSRTSRGAALANEGAALPSARTSGGAASERAVPAGNPEQTAPSVAKEPSVEDVISLIQVGQRALRVSEPAIRVIP